jgi:eukaryotic-like serine/threonine-protein kinase
MGVVYVGEHKLLGRKAAIKVLRRELTQSPDIVNRFFNEARATSQIHHPSIVDYLDFGYDDSGNAYIVMELLAGETLAARLTRTRRLPADKVAVIARHVGSALEAAHRQRVVHRDLKPDNIFLVPDAEVAGGERAKVLDFGIAKLAGDAGASNVFKTRTGSIMGTPVYMSPEQCRGAGRVDERSDIYSLGCVMYQMLCGRPPFVAEGYGELIALHLTGQPERPSVYEPSVPRGIEDVVMKSLTKDPHGRQQTMAELCGELGGEVRPGLRPTVLRPQAPAPIPPTVDMAPIAVGTAPAIASPSTTVDRATGESVWSVIPRPRRRWLVLVFLLVAAGIAVAIAVFQAGGDERQPADQPETRPAPESPPAPAASTPPSAPPPEERPAEPTEAVDEPKAEPKEESVQTKPAESRAKRKPKPRPKPRKRGGVAEPDL